MKNACYETTLEFQRYLLKSWNIHQAEALIDPEKELYLITWVPDPKRLPDVDFVRKHEYHAWVLITYCVCCAAGAFCVESTQKGQPHYHGWYQLSPNPDLEEGRIAMINTMQLYGMVDIKVAGCYRNFSWTKSANALHYYKKDMLDSMLWIRLNPIWKESEDPVVDENELSMYFKVNGRATSEQVLAESQKYKTTFQFYLNK